MKKQYLIFADWRKKDIIFLNTLKLNRDIKEGYFGFNIEEGTIYNNIIAHFSKKDSLVAKTKPKKFSIEQVGCLFSEEELNQANHLVLTNIGAPKGYPQPNTNSIYGFYDATYVKYCKQCAIYDKQENLFRIKQEPNWTKNQVNFSLNWVFDAMFFKKDFFQEVLQPLGLQYKDVIIHNTNKISKSVVQLNIPIAKSSLSIEGTKYDSEKVCSVCNKKKYSQKTLDFFPTFKKNFDDVICKTKESFGETNTQMAYRKIIISKEFCKVLVKHKIIKYNTHHIYPVKTK